MVQAQLLEDLVTLIWSNHSFVGNVPYHLIYNWQQHLFPSLSYKDTHPDSHPTIHIPTKGMCAIPLINSWWQWRIKIRSTDCTKVGKKKDYQQASKPSKRQLCTCFAEKETHLTHSTLCFVVVYKTNPQGTFNKCLVMLELESASKDESRTDESRRTEAVHMTAPWW